MWCSTPWRAEAALVLALANPRLVEETRETRPDIALLVVDRSLEPRPPRIVVAVLDGAFTLKRLARQSGQLRLEAANPAYPALELQRCGDVQIWGVAIHVIHPL